MATLGAAEFARTTKGDQLRELGAHAIEVAPLGSEGKGDFGVVAYFARKPRKAVPKTIEVKHGRKMHKVPVRVKIAREFQAESRLE